MLHSFLRKLPRPVQPDRFFENVLVQECNYRVHPWRCIVLAGYSDFFLLCPCAHPLARFHAAPVFRPYFLKDALDSSPLPRVEGHLLKHDYR